MLALGPGALDSCLPIPDRFALTPMTDPAPETPSAHSSESVPRAGDIPKTPEGTPLFGATSSDADENAAPGPTPPFDFWQAVYTRRSIRPHEKKPDNDPRREFGHGCSGPTLHPCPV